ncbi:hypothetical protein FA13DRAFT_1730700 [Coprinellus micaceus]|uniref:Uncharacterized protein n=1 Tax=Coprinellus micaceus TaxID=71717 RepID=A0A4Y7TI24_COPMI|nr:hypothetical protein FA13DRAFT_1730700 [Coprinellus micaceus]
MPQPCRWRYRRIPAAISQAFLLPRGARAISRSPKVSSFSAHDWLPALAPPDATQISSRFEFATYSGTIVSAERGQKYKADL